MSKIKPQLDAHDVGLVAIGLEEFGLEEFIEGKFFDGELFLDQDYACYKGLDMVRISKLGMPMHLLGSTSRAALAKANKEGITGNLAGDGNQLGGTYVIEKGGNVLYAFKQKTYGDHPPVGDLLETLGIKDSSSS